MVDNTVLTGAYMPGSPSMDGDGGSELSPDFEGKVAEDRGTVSQRIMDNSIDYTMPAADMTNLNPTNDGSAKGS